MQYEEIHHLASRFGTPFYLLHADKFMDNYREIEAAFRSRYNKFIIGYSYKTNYIPFLCNLVKNAGGYAEVVSRLEYDLALRIGQDPGKIIFNGPVKNYADIELALRNRSLVNLDSWYEIDHVATYVQNNPGVPIEVGLRVNVNLTDVDGVSNVQAGLASGRFGFEVGTEGIYKAIRDLEAMPNVTITGLHGHSSSSSRSLWVYERITKVLCDVAAEANLETLEYIDVGGGIFGKIPKEMQWAQVPTFDDYAESVCSVLNSYPWVKRQQPTLILEPGVAVTANCMSFVASVIDVKHINQTSYVLVNGSVFNVKPSLHTHNLPHSFLREQGRDSRNRYKVCGYTCMEKDILLDDILDDEVQRGDFLKIDNVGAYTIVMAPPFITTCPPIIAKIDGIDTVIRQRQDFDGFFGDFSFTNP